MSLQLIGRKEYKYNENITINIPLVKQIRGKNPNEESNFWQEVNLFIITPSDMISELDSQGIDFQAVSDFSLFLYELVNTNAIQSIKIGRKHIIPKFRVIEFLQNVK